MVLVKIYRFILFVVRYLKKEYQYDEYLKRLQKDGEFELKGNNKLWKTSIGKKSYVSLNSIIYCSDIGKYCSIGPNVVIGYGDHPTNYISTSPRIFFREIFTDRNKNGQDYYKSHERVQIGNDVWIGANCFIKNGIKIGDGAIIGAGSIVLKDVPAFSIYAGIPAKFIKNRFDEKVIEELKLLKWWDWEETTLRKMEPFFSKELTEGVIEAIKEKEKVNE